MENAIWWYEYRSLRLFRAPLYLWFGLTCAYNFTYTLRMVANKILFDYVIDGNFNLLPAPIYIILFVIGGERIENVLAAAVYLYSLLDSNPIHREKKKAD